MKSPLNFGAIIAVASVFGCSLIDAGARNAHGAASSPGAPAGYQLLTPRGAGPFPAVIVMHGCSGITANHTSWAHRLVGWGYAALIVDSLGPRGLSNVCGGGLSVSTRAGDAVAAANYLRSLPKIAKGRIGLVGFSHGGGAALAAANDAAFRAVVAFYPAVTCSGPDNTLILIGDADDWTPSSRCRGGATNVKIYPGATHGFDSRAPDRIYLGHHMSYNAAATADAIDRTHRFFSSRLGR
jgi:dienelactone hydrolase